MKNIGKQNLKLQFWFIRYELRHLYGEKVLICSAKKQKNLQKNLENQKNFKKFVKEICQKKICQK